MTRERYETLSVAVLKDLAKTRGIKGAYALKKQELIDKMVEIDEKESVAQVLASSDPAREKKKTKSGEGKSDKASKVKASKEKSSKGKSSKEKVVKEKGVKDKADKEKSAKASKGKGNGEKALKDKNEKPVHADNGTEVKENGEAYDTTHVPENSDLANNIEGDRVCGILEVMQDGFGFIRSDNFLPGENDIYVSPSQIRRFNLKTGDMINGITRKKASGEKFGALLFISKVNELSPEAARNRMEFEKMTPVFPFERIRLERPGGTTAARLVDILCPIGKGQRGMIVSPPKAGKTTLLKDIAKSILFKDPDANLIILLVDERPEEVTDMKESVHGKNVEIIYSTFDELPEHHKRVSEMVMERAKRLVEHKQDVVILLDSITRLARAYNVLVPQSGRTLSGGLDPTALYMPKKFFGAARKMREGGSLTILATALVDTGSKMDDVVYEEFKGTGNMELILDRKLQERRVFPAIDIQKSGTRREDLLLSPEELEAVNILRRSLNSSRTDEATDAILNLFARLKTNSLVVSAILQRKIL